MKNISLIDVSNISLRHYEAVIVGSLAARSADLKYLNLQFCQIEDEILDIIGRNIKGHQIHVSRMRRYSYKNGNDAPILR